MIKIKVGNSTSKVTGLTNKQFGDLSKLMSYDIDPSAAYFSGRAHNTRRSLLSRQGEFPTGLEYLFWQWKSTILDDIEVVDSRKRPKADANLELNLPFVPYPAQLEAAVAAEKYARGILCAPTGSGKSVIIALIIWRLQVPTLVVVPSLELKRQLTESLRACFGRLHHITVENVDALNPEVVDAKHKCVIIDEFHHSAAKTYRELNKKAWKNIYYRFGMTATPFRSLDNEKILLESVLSQVIYDLPYGLAVLSKFIVPVEAYYCEVPKVTPMKGNDRDWATVYSELIVNNKARNTAIAEILFRLTCADVPTLCLVKEIKHGRILSDLTGVPFANGKDGKSQELIRQFNTGQITSLIGTDGVIGEGVDTKPAEFILLASTGKSKTQFMQNCGRGMRVHKSKESAKVILFKDTSHKYLTRHFNSCMLYLRDEYGVKAGKL